MYGNLEVVRTLLDGGGDINVKSNVRIQMDDDDDDNNTINYLDYDDDDDDCCFQ